MASAWIRRHHKLTVLFAFVLARNPPRGRLEFKGRIILHPLEMPGLSRRKGACFTSRFEPGFPMSLTSSDILRIANLARLELNGSESERLLKQINGFFELVEQMRAVDTQGIEPLAHPMAAVSDIALRLRDDVACERDERDANLRNAPRVERGLLLVPRVIE